MSRVNIGQWGEDVACRYLSRKKYRIIEKNYRLKTGEIDIIAQKDEYIVFIEVKTRSSNQYGRPSQAVSDFKKKRIVKTALQFICEKKMLNQSIRFDIVEIDYATFNEYQVNHIENAFECTNLKYYY